MRTCFADNCDSFVWGTCKISRKGYCKRHQHLREDHDKRSIMERAMDKQKAKMPSISSLPRASVEFKRNNDELSKWFNLVATFIRANPYCENCGESIIYTGRDILGKPQPERYFRHASAHIFPKSIFGSVKTHPLNFLILGAGCGCHNDFDHSVEKASKMQIWDKAVSRYKQFEHLILENHKYLDLFKSKIIEKPLT